MISKGSFTQNEIQPNIFTQKYLSIIQSTMGDGNIQPIIQPIAIGTMLNNNGLNISDELNFITCEQTLNCKIMLLVEIYDCQ